MTKPHDMEVQKSWTWAYILVIFALAIEILFFTWLSGNFS